MVRTKHRKAVMWSKERIAILVGNSNELRGNSFDGKMVRFVTDCYRLL